MIARRLCILPGRFTLFAGSRVLRGAVDGVAAFRAAGALMKKPRLTLAWLLRAHMAQGLLALFVLSLYLPRGSGHLLRSSVLAPGLAAATLLALWISIPAAARRGERKAMALEGEADGLIDGAPADAAGLCRQALKYTVSTTHAGKLRRKIEMIEGAEGKAAAANRARHRLAERQELDAEERYETLRIIGRGSLGAVLLVRDKSLGREVAVKGMPASMSESPELFGRFKREVKNVSRLTHPGIVQVFDYAEMGNNVWVMMEYVRGEELGEVMARHRRAFPVAETVRIGALLAAAMEYAHGHGITHGAVKPSNIIVDGSGQPKLRDFVVERLKVASKKAHAAMALEALAFMSPEQAAGCEADERSDVYSLGAIMYTLLTGRRPFVGLVEEVLEQVQNDKPLSIKELKIEAPPRLSKLIMAMLERKAGNRPASMSEVLDVLSQVEQKV